MVWYHIGYHTVGGCFMICEKCGRFYFGSKCPVCDMGKEVKSFDNSKYGSDFSKTKLSFFGKTSILFSIITLSLFISKVIATKKYVNVLTATIKLNLQIAQNISVIIALVFGIISCIERIIISDERKNLFHNTCLTILFILSILFLFV